MWIGFVNFSMMLQKAYARDAHLVHTFFSLELKSKTLRMRAIGILYNLIYGVQQRRKYLYQEILICFQLLFSFTRGFFEKKY